MNAELISLVYYSYFNTFRLIKILIEAFVVKPVWVKTRPKIIFTTPNVPTE